MFFREFHHWKDSHVEMDNITVAYIYESSVIKVGIIKQDEDAYHNPCLFDFEGNLVFDAIPYNGFKFCVIEVE